MDHDKKIEQIGVKLPDDVRRALRLLAEDAGVSPPELIRELIARHLQDQRDRYRALHSIFGDEP